MRCRRVFVAALLFSGHAFAQPDVQVTGSFEQILPQTQTNQSRPLARGLAKPTSVTLLKVELSNHAKQTLSSRLANMQHRPNTLLTTEKSNGLPSHVQLGMNDVPVFDQGQHGSCATFANTAAVDAALNRGDYISQLCQLQLGQHLEHFGHNPSGWNGSIGPVVLSQMQAFGIVSKAVQKQNGCGGLTDYPAHNKAPQTEMSLAEYHQLSEPLPAEEFAWSPLLDVYHVFLDRVNPETTLNNVKRALSNKDRVTIGVLLIGPQNGVVGAVAKHHVANDTWALSPRMIEILQDLSDFGGHAMVITGFDDKAVAIDDDGFEHRGLLTLRNSWGNRAGDHGDFYMSYDYFKLLTIELQRIRSLNFFGS